MLLAALRIYGVISYSVTQQAQAIGIRMALGASTGRVQRQVPAGAPRLALAGMLGTLLAISVAKLIPSLLFAASSWDLPTYLVTVLALLLVAAVPGYIPARRASSLSPMVVLRSN